MFRGLCRSCFLYSIIIFHNVIKSGVPCKVSRGYCILEIIMVTELRDNLIIINRDCFRQNCIMRVRQPDNQEEDPDVLKGGGRGGGDLGETLDADGTSSE